MNAIFTFVYIILKRPLIGVYYFRCGYTLNYTDNFCLYQLFQTVFVYNFIMQTLFGERLKMLRKEKGLKQEEIAAILGCTQRKISYLEQGVSEPDLQTLFKLADYFGVSIDFLCGRTEY